MKEKLKNYMDYLSLTAAQLADHIGVQRSSFSHILNGRNKPSADFISKLLQAYPDLNANWLFGGSDNMLLSQRVKSSMRDLFSVEEPVETNPQITLKAETETFKIKNIIESENKTTQPDIQKDKTIEKIIIFYNDRSFREYNPEK